MIVRCWVIKGPQGHLGKEKGPRCIVNSLVSCYNHHFTLSTEIEKYDKTCPQPSLESCLLGIQVVILWFCFPIRMPMKNRLWNTLKELKTKTTNEDGA